MWSCLVHNPNCLAADTMGQGQVLIESYEFLYLLFTLQEYDCGRLR